eukprot:m.84296 g.84296  ORF g.84296 m.84296 type:complete len:296 (-) comp12959_c0_seq7:1417-2304(-)
MLAGWILAVSAFVGLMAGVLIGSVGVGGIIIVPILVELPDIDIHVAIAAAMFSYIFVGIAGGIAYSRKKIIQWGSVIWLLIGATPGAFVGAFTLQYVSSMAIKMILYSLVLATSVFSLYNTLRERYISTKREGSSGLLSESPSSPELNSSDEPWNTLQGRVLRLVIGCVTGFASAITGTSGPVVLLPILFLCKWDVLNAAGSAQMIQFPIAVAATLAQVFLSDGVDFALGACIAAGLSPGAFIGAAIAFAVKADTLKLVISIILVVAAIFLIGKLIYTEEHSAGNQGGNKTMSIF